MYKLPKQRFVRSSRSLLLAGATLAVGAVAETNAYAADASAAPPGSTQSAPSDQQATVAIGEVLVTARHRTEDIQKVPAAVTVISGAHLESANLTNLSQIVTELPSIQFFAVSPKSTQINIRGLGTNISLANDGLDPGVGFYVDGVYYSRPGPSTLDLIDVSNIQILNGPQGTLFGKNTTAGAISVTTASPTFQPEGLAEVSVGNYSYFQAKAAVSGPIVADTLAGRLSVAWTSHAGFYTNAFDGQRYDKYSDGTIRGQLLYRPTDDFQIRLIGDYSKSRSNCCVDDLSGIVTPPNGKNFTAMSTALGYPPAIGTVNFNTPMSLTQNTGGVSAEADWKQPKFVLTSISAWRYWNWGPATGDLDLSEFDIFHAEQTTTRERQYSEELRVASAGANVVDYVGGLYYLHEDIDDATYFQYGSQASYFLISTAFPAIVLNGLTANQSGIYHSDSYAAYGQATWHVTPRLNLTGGLRYNYDSKTGAFNEIASDATPLTGALAAFTPIRTALATNSAFNARASNGFLSSHVDLSYQATDSILGYVSFSRGNRSEGINLTPITPGESPVVLPETINSYEIGLKTRWFDNKLTLNGDIFYEDDSNYQATVYNSMLFKSYLANVPQASSKGVELNAQARPDEHLSLYASATYDDAVYVKFPAAPCPLEESQLASCSLSGAGIPDVPRWAVSAGGEYTHAVALASGSVDGYLGLDYSFRSSMNTSPSDSIYSVLPSLNLVNLRAGIRAADARWDVYLWAKNIAGVRYNISVAPGLGNTGALYGLLADPRTFGATLRFKY